MLRVSTACCRPPAERLWPSTLVTFYVGVYFGHQNSVFGHNICLGRRTKESYCNAIGVFEPLMLKRNILAVSGCDFTVRDIDLQIQSMCDDLF